MNLDVQAAMEHLRAVKTQWDEELDAGRSIAAWMNGRKEGLFEDFLAPRSSMMEELPIHTPQQTEAENPASSLNASSAPKVVEKASSRSFINIPRPADREDNIQPLIAVEDEIYQSEQSEEISSSETSDPSGDAEDFEDDIGKGIAKGNQIVHITAQDSDLGAPEQVMGPEIQSRPAPDQPQREIVVGDHAQSTDGQVSQPFPSTDNAADNESQHRQSRYLEDAADPFWNSNHTFPSPMDQKWWAFGRSTAGRRQRHLHYRRQRS